MKPSEWEHWQYEHTQNHQVLILVNIIVVMESALYILFLFLWKVSPTDLYSENNEKGKSKLSQ